MSSTGEVNNLTSAVEQPAKGKKAKVLKEKKAKSAKTASHPPYFQMIKEALLALKEKGGSSPHAIGKYMEDKHKAVLPENFRKMLALQLKKSASNGKLTKVKASYKLTEDGKKAKAPAAGAVKKAKKPATSAARATAAVATGGLKKAEAASKKVVKANQAKKTVKATPAKKAVKATPVKKSKKMTPTKAKQPKSIKSPAAKRARKATA